MIAAILIGLAIIFAGYVLFRHAAGVETAIYALHRSLGVIPLRWLDAMRRFNIVSLRVVAVLWIALGGAALVLTFTKFVPE
ncbi:hypothetical protein OK349_09615 [Sphingomonas sp. BT-65]|uniref:hypothetical protein n=1 Tax=Sphingomonas sp. BT-65 TaxID=2989821 RepID=UPI0022358FD9|nr:hypothetical protein [Sphingomonas sp. BT-65]MCW4461963.1 hypothetical protein [Sphingomonas sp. BT-65]